MTESADRSTAPAPSSFNFDHLQVAGKTARYQLGLVAEGAWIEGLPAIPDLNDAYRDGMLANASKRDRIRKRLASATQVGDEKESEEERREDIELFASSVLVSWHGIVDSSGTESEFSPENAAAFLHALPPWLFDRIRLFFKFPDTFVSRAPRPGTKAEQVVGN